jgi:outer membrane lipoprotein-sorting protein
MKTPLDNDLKKAYEVFSQKHNQLRDSLMASLPSTSKQHKQRSKLAHIGAFIGDTIMKSRIRKLATAAVIIIAVILGLNFIGRPSKSGLVFADVVQRIRKARTVTFTTEVQLGQHTMKFENARKEPGLKRTVAGDTVMISDPTQKKAIFIDHSKKQYTERDLENVPAEQTQDFFEHMRALPDLANEVLAKKEMDGRIVQGFCVIEHGIDAIFWIDVQTRDLVRVEGQFPNAPNTRIVGTDFKFDVELDDALFSLTPPAGYMKKKPLKMDRSEVNCQDLINLLRWFATTVEGGLFPPSLKPAEFAKVGSQMKKEGKVSKFKGTEDEKKQHTMKLARGMQFVIMMKPENDWHYGGKGVELGDADTAICWYRPDGSETYRVIYGDLSVKEVAPENLPK